MSLTGYSAKQRQTATYNQLAFYDEVMMW